MKFPTQTDILGALKAKRHEMVASFQIRPNLDTGTFFHVVNIAFTLARQLLIYQLSPIKAMLDPVAATLDQYMSLVSARQKLVTSNIANADTPGYTTKDINFQTEFQNAMSGSQSPAIFDVAGLTLKNDGNNVNLDREARLLSENALRFSVASNLLRGQLKIVRMAIDGGSSA